MNYQNGLVSMVDKGVNYARTYLNNSVKTMGEQGTKVALTNGLAAGGVKLVFEANDYLSGNKELTKGNILNSTKEVGYSTGLGLATSGMPLTPAIGLNIVGDWVKDGKYDVNKTYSSNILGGIVDHSLENSKFKSTSPIIREFITNAHDKYYETKGRNEVK